MLVRMKLKQYFGEVIPAFRILSSQLRLFANYNGITDYSSSFFRRLQNKINSKKRQVVRKNISLVISNEIKRR